MKGMFFRVSKVALLLTLTLGLNSCMDEGPAGESSYERLRKEVAAIDSYLMLSINPVIKDPSGLRFEIISLGSGLPAAPDSFVDVDYVGRLFSDNSVFDSGNTADQNDVAERPTRLNGYITGWQIAFATLPAGTQGTLYIPSGYAYANQAKPNIPANSILKFDVTFNGVELTQTEINQFEKEKTAIAKYITDNNISDVVVDESGMSYKITQAGEGPSPSWFDKLSLKYTIKLLSNPLSPVVTLNRNPSNEFPSRLVDYINGMKVGLSKMNKGSKATLYVPSLLAFGTSGASDGSGSSVPKDASLIIEIELTDIAFQQ